MAAQPQTANQINLVPREFRTPSSMRRIVSILKRTSIVFLGVYLAGLALVTVASFLFNQEKNSLLQNNERLTQDVEDLKAQEKLVQIVKNRVSLAREVLGKTPTVSTKTLNDAILLVPSDIQIVSLDTEGGTVSLSAKAQDGKILSTFFADLAKSKFSTVFLDDLTLDESGFNFKITLQ